MSDSLRIPSTEIAPISKMGYIFFSRRSIDLRYVPRANQIPIFVVEKIFNKSVVVQKISNTFYNNIRIGLCAYDESQCILPIP